MDVNVASFVDITGATPDQAAMFLEMMGGNLELAIASFFENMGGGMPMEGIEEQAGLLAAVNVPVWWRVIWPAAEVPPEAWREQRLDNGEGGWKGGIPQPKNGPCGVLAAVHSNVLAEQHARAPADIEVSAEALGRIITQMLTRCRPSAGDPVRLVRPKQRGDYGPSALLDIVELSDMSAVAAEVNERIEAFRGPGGIIDLVYSAVFTRGLELVEREATSEGGELPLVPKAFSCWLCSMELMSLLLRGSAHGNVGCHRADATRNSSWDEANLVGVLSSAEKEQGIPVTEALKSPKAPVWILHGGDHFTVAWAQSMPSSNRGTKFTLHFWNGLPPGGPKLVELTITAVKGALAGKQERAKFYKPEPGEVDEVVQADPEDKKQLPGQYRRWRFEVMLAWDRPDLEGEVRGPEVPPEPKFSQEDPRYQKDGPWRCRRCYDQRFKMECFPGLVADSPNHCPRCDKPRKECGWSLWMPFADLPPAWQAAQRERWAKKIEPILWTKWPDAEIVDAAGNELPAC